MIEVPVLILMCAYLHAETGASLPWSKRLQEIVGEATPERLLAAVVTLCAVFGWGLWSMPALWGIPLVFGMYFVSLAGIETGTWAYLDWTGHKTRVPRKSTLYKVNNWIANKLGYELGDEGYSWVWAAVKGFIITLPVGGTGLITFPFGHELGSHAKGRLPGDPNMWKELSSGAAIGLSCALLLLI